MRGDFLKASAVLVGTIVGAGIFGLPYAFSKAGFLVGLIYLLFFALVFLVILLSYGEVILKTKEDLEMSGYVKRYLGSWGKFFIALSLIVGITGALLAYTIGVGTFLHSIFSPYFGGKVLIYSLIFWFLASLAVYRGIGIVAKLELIMSLFLILVVFFIFGISKDKIDFANLSFYNLENLFYPYGVVLFALGGATAVATMKRILENNLKLLKPAIFLGFLIPLFIYFLWTFSIVGVTGVKTSPEGIIGLAGILGRKIIFIGGIFGILSMSTSFLALGYVLKEFYHRDLKIPKIISFLLTVGLPLILYLLGIRKFVEVLGFSGGILSGIQGILLIATHQKAQKLEEKEVPLKIRIPSFLAYFIYLIFILGILYQFLYLKEFF